MEQPEHNRKDLTTLVVDDDEFVRKILSHQLATLGVHTVVTAEDGDQARVELQNHELFNLILCDLMMPGTDGIALLRDIAALQPEAGLILISSADRRVLNTAQGIAQERKLRVLGTLAKPVSRQALEILLARLDQPTVGAPHQDRPSMVTADDLEKAIACGELTIEVQPVVDIHQQQLTSVEALARWNSPIHGPVPPDEFVPLAEAYGLIRQLTDITLHAAAAACAQWLREGLDIRIAVNLSPFVLEDLTIPEEIVAVAEQYGLPVQNLLLEITESGVFRDIATSLDILTRLRLRGMNLALDDYGTGHSSLKQLLSVPFTELKLDRMFLQGSEVDPEKRHVVESTIVLAHDLGLKVISEGVETEEQLALLGQLGSDYAQGFLIARPMPVDQLMTWASQYSRNSQT